MIMMYYLYGSYGTGDQNSYCKYDKENNVLIKEANPNISPATTVQHPYYTYIVNEDVDSTPKLAGYNNTFDLSKLIPKGGVATKGYYYNTASHCVFIFAYAQHGNDIIFMARNSWGQAHDKGNSYFTSDFIDGRFKTSPKDKKYPNQTLPIFRFAKAMKKADSENGKSI